MCKLKKISHRKKKKKIYLARLVISFDSKTNYTERNLRKPIWVVLVQLLF